MPHFWMGKFSRPAMPSTMAMCATGANPLAERPMNSDVLVVGIVRRQSAEKLHSFCALEWIRGELLTDLHVAACGPSARGLNMAENTTVAQIMKSVM